MLSASELPFRLTALLKLTVFMNGLNVSHLRLRDCSASLQNLFSVTAFVPIRIQVHCRSVYMLRGFSLRHSQPRVLVKKCECEGQRSAAPSVRAQRVFTSFLTRKCFIPGYTNI